MNEIRRLLWEVEESVEARANAAFAFLYLTDLENVAIDAGIDRVEADGKFRDRPGMRGTTYHVGGGATEWVVSDAEPGRRFAIDVAIGEATLRFEFRFETAAEGGCVITQRVSLCGPGAEEYVDGITAAFGGTLRDGMRSIRDRIDAEWQKR